MQTLRHQHVPWLLAFVLLACPLASCTEDDDSTGNDDGSAGGGGSGGAAHPDSAPSNQGQGGGGGSAHNSNRNPGPGGDAGYAVRVLGGNLTWLGGHDLDRVKGQAQ